VRQGRAAVPEKPALQAAEIALVRKAPLGNSKPVEA
jgi:hypothetical protein